MIKTDALKIPEVRLFISSLAFFTLARSALAVVIGFQIYRLTHSPLMLGWLGLVEAIPVLSLVLYGGYVADHFNRQRILLITRGISCLCGVALIAISMHDPATSLFGLFSVIFVVGLARGFSDPAGTAFESQIIPKHLTVNASSWITSTWVTCAVAGPAAIGFMFDAWGAEGCYTAITISYLISWVCLLGIPKKSQPAQENKEPLLKSIGSGLQFVFHNQALLGALALDLFAVFFGGAMALLPVYAEDILKVGAKGLGLLNAAPSLGALLVTLSATKHAPIEKAGRNLLLAVAGFGVSILVFAVSRNFWVSLVALFFSGAFDGVSMVIRRSMVRLLSPDLLRGRIASANWIFICASNELGAFESGMLASLIGVVPCVVVGGFATLGIVGFTAWRAKQLRTLQFDTRTLERKS